MQALKRTELELKQARDYAQAIVETVSSVLVLDTDLRVTMANDDSFYRLFRVTSLQTENRLLYELGNGQWNIPSLRTFLEDILPQHWNIPSLRTFLEDILPQHSFSRISR